MEKWRAGRDKESRRENLKICHMGDVKVVGMWGRELEGEEDCGERNWSGKVRVGRAGKFEWDYGRRETDEVGGGRCGGKEGWRLSRKGMG